MTLITNERNQALDDAQLAQLQADAQVAVARAHESEARAQAQQAQAKLDEARTAVELARDDGWDQAQVVLTQANAIGRLLKDTTYHQDEIVAAVTANNLSKLLDHTNGLPLQADFIPPDVND